MVGYKIVDRHRVAASFYFGCFCALRKEVAGNHKFYALVKLLR